MASALFAQAGCQAPSSSTALTAPNTVSRAVRGTKCLHRASCRKLARHTIIANGLDIGDFGARDPTPAEVASNFGDKVIGNWDTSHIIRGPEGLRKIVGLHTKTCRPSEPGDKPLERDEAEVLRNQVPGWQLREGSEGSLCLRQEWKVRDFMAGLSLMQAIGDVAQAEGHHPDLHLEGYNTVYAELSTHSLGGLTENDFIVAAKINLLDVSHLLPKRAPRFWA